MSNNPSNNSERTIYSVSELNRSVASVLDETFSWVWVEGEISNLARPSSGHLYFSLKDADAQVSCAMFRGNNRHLKFAPENGSQVIVRAKVGLYQPRGNYQLIIDSMEEAGNGRLQRQFEELKAKLHKEGLFDEAHKLEIPELPGCIGLITSSTGAAIHDVLSVIARRFPAIPVKLYPVPVQGEQAAPAICRALSLAEKHGACDVLLLVRGGGSLEDLWSFNNEAVARAIFHCPIPVVSGIGHEVDVTIADLVADWRAATPTAAAETVTPEMEAWIEELNWYQERLSEIVNRQIERQLEKLLWLRKRLSQQHPIAVYQRLSQKLDDLEQRLRYAWRYQLQQICHLYQGLNNRLQRVSPAHALQVQQHQLQLHWQRLHSEMNSILSLNKSRLGSAVRTLQAISPLQTLERGFSITTDHEGHHLLDAHGLKIGDKIQTRLYKGKLISRLEKITN